MNHKPAKLLLVEDDRLCQMSFQFVTRSLQVTIDVASCGQDALNLFQKEQYDIIFMDMGLPDQDGLLVIQKMRALERENSLNTSPIAVLTTHDDDENRNLSFEAGANAFIGKPITLEKLKHLVASLNLPSIPKLD